MLRIAVGASPSVVTAGMATTLIALRTRGAASSSTTATATTTVDSTTSPLSRASRQYSAASSWGARPEQLGAARRYRPPSSSSPSSSGLRRAEDSQHDDEQNNNINARFARSEGDPSLLHGVAPENLRFLHEDDAAERIGADAAAAAAAVGIHATVPGHPELAVPPHRAASSEAGSIAADAASAFLGFDGDAAFAEHRRQQRDAVPTDAARPPLPALAARALAAERMIQQALDSGAPDAAKAATCLELAASVTGHDLPIRARIVEEVFLLWTNVSTEALLRLSADGGGVAALPRPTTTTASSSSSADDGADNADDDTATAATAAAVADSARTAAVRQYLEPMLRLYFHLRRHHTAPTPGVIEHLMSTLHMVSDNKANHRFMMLASRLMLDSDRFTVLCSRIAYATYFDICAINDAMDIALVRFADAKTRLFIEPDGGMVRAIVAGCVRNGLASEALAFLGRVSAVQVDAVFLNSMLELLSLSQEPMAAFAAFRSLEGAGVVADSTTFFHLLRACEASGQWETGAPFVLAQMQRLRVRGDDVTLNLLLKGLVLSQGMAPYAAQLYLAMKQKAAPIFDEVEAALPEPLRRRGAAVAAGIARRKSDRRSIRRPSRDAIGRALLLGGEAAALADVRAGGGGGGGGGGGSEAAASSPRPDANARDDAALEAFLRHQAARGRLGAAALLETLCVFALRRRLGTVEELDRMQEFVALQRQLSRDARNSSSNARAGTGTSSVDAAADDVTVEEKYAAAERGRHRHHRHRRQPDGERQSAPTSAGDTNPTTPHDADAARLAQLARSLRPRLWRIAHRHLYGVEPAATAVVDMRRGATGGGRGRRGAAGRL